MFREVFSSPERRTDDRLLPADYLCPEDHDERRPSPRVRLLAIVGTSGLMWAGILWALFG